MKRPGRVIQGPWQAPAPRLEGHPFEALSDDQQRAALRYAMHDIARYVSDLSQGELAWLRRHLPLDRPVQVEALTAEQRARLAGALLLILHRRGWAA